MIKQNYLLFYRQECDDVGGTDSGSCADGIRIFYSLDFWGMIFSAIDHIDREI